MEDIARSFMTFLLGLFCIVWVPLLVVAMGMLFLMTAVVGFLCMPVMAVHHPTGLMLLRVYSDVFLDRARAVARWVVDLV